MSLLEELQSGKYYAIQDGKTVYSGSLPKVVSYIAQKRAEGFDVEGGAEGATPKVQERRRLHLENCITVHPVGFRIREIDGPPGIYSSELFATESEARTHRAEVLGDPKGEKYQILEADWREARL